ncbi:MAG: tRNA (N6-isopentenyl adenosine(37)-C2)-methylthiotransferase MiaB [Desulfobacterales bacterium]|nr:tRNA (N6-isopentenyl adenosine(37)-C2)-methylthiotransferase MiaB [Desulfobacterales bacterium]
MKTKYLYINTIGCQMNVYDSEQISKVLKPLQYNMTSSLEKADLIIANTCAIREKAEQKVFSFLGRVAHLKRKKPNLILGVGGCVAQQEGSKILERAPYLDLVFGTHAIGRLPSMIERIDAKKCRIVDVEMPEGIDESVFSAYTDYNRKVTSFVTIMQGCDNYCTYCVVPFVRGREASRSPEKIIGEIRSLVGSGIKEITLLGQNVNSFGKKEGLCSFSKLLSFINEIDGLLRIRFTTSHPKDLSDDLIYAFENPDKLCRHIHLPVQSGSDRILKRMNRKYSRDYYLAKVDKLRNICPDIAITSDFIVGFPGETEDDFNETLDLIKTVQYDDIFAFKYSDRPKVPSALFRHKISEQDKKDRLIELLKSQEYYTKKKNKVLEGSTQSILVEGLSKKKLQTDAKNKHVQWTGRTSTNKIVNFISNNDVSLHNENFLGKMINVRIEKALSHSLQGIRVK